MTEKNLSRANEISNKIRRLDAFICTAQKLWEGQLTIKKPKMCFHILGYGAFGGSEIQLNTSEKDAVLSVLIAERDTLKKELEGM